MENVVDRLRFRSANQCDISAELKFVASHFYAFLPRPQTLTALPFSLLYGIIGHGSLRLETEDSLLDFINEAIETGGEMFGLLEFVRLEYCSMDAKKDFFDLLWENFCKINASLWATLRARIVLSHRTWTQFPPSMKKGNVHLVFEEEEEQLDVDVEIDVPEGIIAHLARECGGNVHDRHVVDATSGSFEKEPIGVNPHSGAYDNHPDYAAKNAADLETDSWFLSAYRHEEEVVSHTRNNWVCYDFKERMVVPTHYTIRSHDGVPDYSHLKSWVVETSADGESWREVAREENSEQLNSSRFTGTFAVAGGGESRFIRLVNIGKNHYGDDQLRISAWEIFGALLE
jgi:hypothetical protein